MMSWLKRVLGIPEQKHSAVTAKERLMVIVAHERGNHETQPDFLPLLQKELTEVIAKYVQIDQNQVQVDFEQKGGRSVLELNITLPDHQLRSAVQSIKPVAAQAVTEEKKPVTKTKKPVAKAPTTSKPKSTNKTTVKKPAKKLAGTSAAGKTAKATPSKPKTKG